MALVAFLNSDVGLAKSNPALREVFERYEGRITLPRNQSVVAKMEEVKAFINNIITYANTGVSDLTNGAFYDYFRSSLYWDTSVPDQLKFREQILEALKSGASDVKAYTDRLPH